MSTFSDPFSAVRQMQLEASLAMFQKFSSRAVATTGQLLALNMQTARSSLEQSADVVRQVLGADDPRDLLPLTKRTQAGIDGCLAYGQALFRIATGVESAVTAAPSAPAAQPSTSQDTAPVVLDLPGENAPVVVQSDAAATEASVALPIPEQVAAVKVKPIAKAVNKATPKAVKARPAAAPTATPAAQAKPVKVTGLKAVQAAKPAAESPQLDMLATKSKKKK